MGILRDTPSTFARSMFQPSTSFLVGCAMACLVSERGACFVASRRVPLVIVGAGPDSRLHVRIVVFLAASLLVRPPLGDYALGSVKIVQVTTHVVSVE